jgi:hypothetical protein
MSLSWERQREDKNFSKNMQGFRASALIHWHGYCTLLIKLQGHPRKQVYKWTTFRLKVLPSSMEKANGPRRDEKWDC